MKRMVNVCAVICIVTMVFAGKMVNVVGQIIDYPIELALVLDESNRVSDGNFENVRRGIVAFTGRFIMGDNATRMAVVMFSNRARIEVNLTANATMIQQFNRQRDSSSLRSMDEGLKLAKEQVFARDRLDTLKIVIVITNGGTSNESATVGAGKNLRENEARIFIVCVKDNSVDCEKMVMDLRRIAPRPNTNVILGFKSLPGHFDTLVDDSVSCLLTVCQFRDPERKECVAAWWRPLSIAFECDDSSVDPKKNCTMDDCERQCDKWPWKSYNCSGGESEIEVDRRGPRPDGHNVFYDPMFEHCPKKKTVICPRSTDKPPTSTFVPTEEFDSLGTTPSSETVSGSHETAPPSETVTNNTTESVPVSKRWDSMDGWTIALVVLVIVVIVAMAVFVVWSAAPPRQGASPIIVCLHEPHRRDKKANDSQDGGSEKGSIKEKKK